MSGAPHPDEIAVEVEIEDERWSAWSSDPASLAQAAAHAALAAADRRGGVVILLTDDAELADLNLRFRGKAGPTNVLSFPASNNALGHLGDIALAAEICQAEATAQGKGFAHHLQHLVAHGVLHLVGYDHETEEEALTMEALERRIMRGLGAPDPYGDDDGAGGDVR